MKKFGILKFTNTVIMLILLLVAIVGLLRTFNRDNLFESQIVNGTQIKLDPANLKPNYPDGFYFHEDGRHDNPEQDPVFAVLGDKVIKLTQIVDGWNHEEVGLAFLRQYSNLSVVGQISSYMNYQYYPNVGEIRLADGTVVKKYINEYNPPHWVYCWTSFMFINNNQLFIFFVKPDGSYIDMNPIPFS